MFYRDQRWWLATLRQQKFWLWLWKIHNSRLLACSWIRKVGWSKFNPIVHWFSQSVRVSQPAFSQPVSQSVSQSINQSVSQSVNLLVSQPVSQTVSQWVSQSLNQSVSQPVSRTVIQLVIQSVNQSLSQSAIHSYLSMALSGFKPRCLIRLDPGHPSEKRERWTGSWMTTNWPMACVCFQSSSTIGEKWTGKSGNSESEDTTRTEQSVEPLRAWESDFFFLFDDVETRAIKLHKVESTWWICPIFKFIQILHQHYNKKRFFEFLFQRSQYTATLLFSRSLGHD